MTDHFLELGKTGDGFDGHCCDEWQGGGEMIWGKGGL